MDETKAQLPQDIIDYIADITEDFVGQGKLHLVTATCSAAFWHIKQHRKELLSSMGVDALSVALREAARDRLALYDEHAVVEYRKRDDGRVVMAVVSAPNPKTGTYPAMYSDDTTFGTIFIPEFLSLAVTEPHAGIIDTLKESGVATHLSAAHDIPTAPCGVIGAKCLRPSTGCDTEKFPKCATALSAERVVDACKDALRTVSRVTHNEADYLMEKAFFSIMSVDASIIVSVDVIDCAAAQLFELAGSLIDASREGTLGARGEEALDAIKAYSQANRAVIPNIIRAGSRMDMLIAIKEQMGVDKELRDAFFRVFGVLFRPNAVAIPKEAVAGILQKIGIIPGADDDSSDNGPTFH